MDDDVLPRAPGAYVAAALRTLPIAETATAYPMDATIGVPGLGRVRLTAERMRHCRGRTSTYFWTATKGVPVIRRDNHRMQDGLRHDNDAEGGRGTFNSSECRGLHVSMIPGQLDRQSAVATGRQIKWL